MCIRDSFNIAGTNAWLLGCDYDLDTGDPFASNSSDSPFDFAVFANGALETQLEFSHVQTVWSITSGTVTFSKRQIEALSAAGTFVGKPVPDPQASILKEPAVNFNDFKPLPDDKMCIRDRIKGVDGEVGPDFGVRPEAETPVEAATPGGPAIRGRFPIGVCLLYTSRCV